MGSFATGRRPLHLAVTRAGLVCLGLVSALALGACTTTEGTNALTDFGTFEREVMTSTLQGFALVPREEKEETNQRRAPLVLPKDAGSLPPPQTGDVEVAALPVDSDTVQIDTTGLTEADLKRLRNARVVDLHTLSGRPLTEQESRQLTARMTAARLQGGKRPLYMPPEEYFTTVGGQDLVCRTKKGDIVPVTHRDCPYEIKTAIGRQQPQSAGRLGDGPEANLSDTLGLD